MSLVDTLLVRLDMDASGYTSEARKAARATDDIGDAAGKAGRRGAGGMDMLGGAAKKMGGLLAGAFAVKQVGQFVGSTITAAADLGEAVNATNVVFRDAAGTITEYGKTAATSVGLAQTEFNQLATNTGALLTNFGMSTQQAADEAINLTERAADMASVFNVDVGEALFAVQAALRGEQEPIRRFGVSLDDATIRAKAVEMGLAATTAEVDKNAKATAALSLIYQQTEAVAGDFQNTSGSLANQQRILAAEMENAKAEIGEALLPVMTDVIGAVRDMLPSLVDAGKGFAELLASAGPLVDLFMKGLVPALDAVAWYFDLVGEGSLAIQSIWDDGSRAALRYKEAADSIAESIAKGTQPAAAYANALNHLASNGALTAEAMTELAQGVEFVGEQQLVALRDLRDLAVEQGYARSQVDLLNQEMYTQAKAMVEAGEATEEIYDALGVAGLAYAEQTSAARESAHASTAAGQAAADSADGMEEGAEGASQLAQALDAAREAQESLADVLRAAADPAFAAVKASQQLSEVLAKVGEDGAVTGQEILDLADAQLSAQSAFDALDAAGVEAALEAIAIGSGTSEQAVRDLFTELGVLDAEGDVTTVVDVDVSPAVTALGTYQGALAAAREDGQVTGAELQVLEGHLGDLRDAVGGLDSDGIESFRSRAMRDLGMTREEVDTLLSRLGVLDGFQATATFTLRGLTTGSREALSVAAKSGFRVPGGVFPARQHGGDVEAGQPYIVGEAGRELFIPAGAGRVVPLPQGAGQVTPGGTSTAIYRTAQVTFVNSQLANDPVEGVRAALAWEGLEGGL